MKTKAVQRALIREDLQLHEEMRLVGTHGVYLDAAVLLGLLDDLDEALAEVDRLRALCREAAVVASKVPIIVSEPAKGLDCYSCVGCGALGSRECKIGCWVPRLGQMIRRLNEAGGGT